MFEEPYASDRRRLRAASGVSSAKRTPLEVLISRERLLVDSTLAVRVGSSMVVPAAEPGAAAGEEGITTACPLAPASRRRCLSKRNRSDMLLPGCVLTWFAAPGVVGLACAGGTEDTIFKPGFQRAHLSAEQPAAHLSPVSVAEHP